MVKGDDHFCGQEKPHGKSYKTPGLGAWSISGWAPKTHECLCGTDARVNVEATAGGGGTRFRIDLNLCVKCAEELVTGIMCELDFIKKEAKRSR